MLEAKTEIRMVGHILERGCIFKLSELLEDISVEVMHCEVSFAALKAGVEEKMPSIMRFYLVGEKKNRDEAVERIKMLSDELDCRIEYQKEIV